MTMNTKNQESMENQVNDQNGVSTSSNLEQWLQKIRIVPTFAELEPGSVVDYHDRSNGEKGRAIILDQYDTKFGPVVNIIWIDDWNNSERQYDKDCIKGDVQLDGKLWTVLFR